ncbi:hypothetical protein C8J56DRAFT_911057 [Mycena floridula]|nr:hypothetical protein C8J56DRAFT_911057 [Mycena floridula]
MDGLCDEIVQLIIYELNDPSHLALTCKRFHDIAREPYTRAHYFLARYGPTSALFHALGRKVLTERSLDILMTSGAHLSRYLVQVAFHHFFHTTSHFVKSAWVRNLPLQVFLHFLKLGSERYDNIPRGKGDDDGTIFLSFVKESRFPAHMRHISWEDIRDMLEKYHFIPFSSKDPIMVQFPLVLAIEPRLLPYAVANGFHMDTKYRDFIFRKIFEKPPTGSERTVDDIVQNVKDLCRLDKTMFVSRTVAAEVCMEIKSNIGYQALRALDKSSDLLFDLATVVEDLLKLFLKTRSVTSSANSSILRQLYTDFPSSDPHVRLVLLLTVFTTHDGSYVHPNSIKSRLEPLNLSNITRADICNLFCHPFLDKYNSLLEYMRTEYIRTESDGDTNEKGMTSGEIRSVIEDVAARCLEMESKGKMLKKLRDGFPTVKDVIVQQTLSKHSIDLDDLPPAADVVACLSYEAKLCRGIFSRLCEDDYFWQTENNPGKQLEDTGISGDVAMEVDTPDEETADMPFLGHIGQESLSTMIRHDELLPARSRRRLLWNMGSVFNSLHSSHMALAESLQVGKFIKSSFGARSSVTAVFMTHAVLNNNLDILRFYLADAQAADHVPVTLKHFELLARLGKAPTKTATISNSDSARQLFGKLKVKTEVPTPSIPLPEEASTSSQSTSKKRKRPRRSAADAVASYVVPNCDSDSDDMDYDDHTKKRASDLQLWVKHLGQLLRVEQAKHRAARKKLNLEIEPGTKSKGLKSEFHKSLAIQLRSLRKHDQANRLISNDHIGDDSDDGSDDDYRKKGPNKRRKTTRN